MGAYFLARPLALAQQELGKEVIVIQSDAGQVGEQKRLAEEIAKGIGVRSAFRRRGVAGALTTRLVQDAFASGISVPFLMAAHEAEKRIYARTGFSVVGEILHISRSKS